MPRLTATINAPPSALTLSGFGKRGNKHDGIRVGQGA
jgi:hypothetical protein